VEGYHLALRFLSAQSTIEPTNHADARQEALEQAN
jgi:hypothetical protein